MTCNTGHYWVPQLHGLWTCNTGQYWVPQHGFGGLLTCNTGQYWVPQLGGLLTCNTGQYWFPQLGFGGLWTCNTVSTGFLSLGLVVHGPVTLSVPGPSALFAGLLTHT